MNEDTPVFITKKQFLTIYPHLEKARLRLLLRSLKDQAGAIQGDFISEIFAPPATPEEEQIMIFANLCASLWYHEELASQKMTKIIHKALPEVEEAYQALIKRGGGWTQEGSDEGRKNAVLQWFSNNRNRLTLLKESYLRENKLYEGGGGQERRNFTCRLLAKIIKDKEGQKATIKKIMDLMKPIKNIDQEIENLVSSLLNPQE